VKKYEGLFILNTAGKEEGVKEVIDQISAEITAAGGKVETVQKMDKRPFARVTDPKQPGGYYLNIIFEGTPEVLIGLQSRFRLNEDVMRVVFTHASVILPVPAPEVTVA